MKLSYYNKVADSLDLPTLDAYDNSWLLAPSSYGGPPINLISSPPGISPSPNLSPTPIPSPNPNSDPNEMPPISDPPLSGPSPSPSNSFRSPTGPTLTRLAPTGAPRHRWGKQYAIWCVARPTVPETVLQRAMDYACGNGADCGSVQPSGPCFVPNTLVAHASFAFNSYWQRTKIVGGTCDFGGTAMLITDDPSK